GHDTVSMAMTFAILLLAEHKDVQDRVRTEVNAVMEKNGGKLTMTALQNLSYLERCLKETMRLYPSVLLITRTLVEDVMLKSYLVPAGVELYIDILSLHKNPEFWPNPEVFDPDRFLPELVQNRHPFAYIPFSAGSRNCIGQRFAMMELKTVIGTLVHNFCLEPIDYLKDCRCVVDLIIRIGQPMQRLWDLIKFRFERYSPIYKTWYFTIAYVAITYPDEMQTILNNSKSSTKGMAYKLLRPWMGDGLLLSKGTKWQERRKILTPAFHFHILKNFFSILVEESNRMTISLKHMKDSTVEDLTSFTSHHTLNIICETSMGISLRNIETSEQQQYRKAIHDISEIIIYRVTKDRDETACQCNGWALDRRLVLVIPPPHWHEEELSSFFQLPAPPPLSLVGKRKIPSARFHCNDTPSRSHARRGHDTVSMAMTFAILLLAEYKDVQDRVRNEVNAVMKENGGKLTMTALQNLSYLERCLKETMRLYPSVFFITRTLVEDVMLRKQ
ncbi:Cytochrome P450 4C1, partial [Ooceraea biroi]